MAKKTKNDAYAICTAQKKKSGMGHDEWKRCVDKIKTRESTMSFYKKASKIFVEGSGGERALKKKISRSTDDKEKASLQTRLSNRAKESDKRALASAEKLKKPKGEWDRRGGEDWEKDVEKTAKDTALKSTHGDKLAAKRPGEVRRATQASRMANRAPLSHKHSQSAIDRAFDSAMKRKAELEKRKKLRQSGKPKDGDGDGIVNEHERKILMDFLERVKLLERCRKKNEDAAPFSKPAPFSVPSDAEDADDDGEAGEDDPKDSSTYSSDKKAKKNGKSTNELRNVRSVNKPLPKSATTGGDPDAHDDEEEEMDDEDAGLDTDESKKNEAKKDKDWIQKAVDPDHEGYCTPMTKSTCTPRRKALAKTFKKMGRKRDAETKAKNEEWSDAARKAAADARKGKNAPGGGAHSSHDPYEPSTKKRSGTPAQQAEIDKIEKEKKANQAAHDAKEKLKRYFEPKSDADNGNGNGNGDDSEKAEKKKRSQARMKAAIAADNERERAGDRTRELRGK